MLNFKEVVELIVALGERRTIIVEGENGVGKTALFHALKKHPKFADHIAVDPVDCTQLSDGSVWMPDIDREAGVSRELPNERFGVSKANQKGVNGAKPVLVFLDEIAKAPIFIKNVLAPIVYERRVGNYHMPAGSVAFCATNLGVEGLGDSIQAHLRNRLVFVKMRKPTADEWLKWASDAGINEKIQAAVKLEPRLMESFLDYEKGGVYEGKDMFKENGMVFNPRSTQPAYASPRSLVAAGDVLDTGDGLLDDKIVMQALIGTVGLTAAESIMAMVTFGRKLCPLERILHDPITAPLTDNPTAQLVQVFQFINRINDRESADKVVRYVHRMNAEMQSVFVNQVASSTKVTHYFTLDTFKQMLAEHRAYF